MEFEILPALALSVVTLLFCVTAFYNAYKRLSHILKGSTLAQINPADTNLKPKDGGGSNKEREWGSKFNDGNWF
jgi:hypothetical protein